MNLFVTFFSLRLYFYFVLFFIQVYLIRANQSEKDEKVEEETKEKDEDSDVTHLGRSAKRIRASIMLSTP